METAAANPLQGPEHQRARQGDAASVGGLGMWHTIAQRQRSTILLLSQR